MDEPKDGNAASTPARTDRPVREGITSDPTLAVPQWLLARYNARVLDPAKAVRVARQPVLRPTVYLADKLIVSGEASDSVRGELTESARSKGLRIEPPLEHEKHRERLVSAARTAGRPDADTRFTTLHALEPVDGVAVVADAWDVLQTFRARAAVRPDDHRHVGLDHLLTSTKYTHPSPFVSQSNSAPQATASYGQPGWGGRQPVKLVGPPPVRRADPGCRRPVVAILDTGVGEHDWFPLHPETVVHRNQRVHGAMLGLGEPSQTEVTGVIQHPLEGVLDPYSGHGTFIAGLVHQECPDADILSIRVMPSEGAVPEHVLLDALNLLVCRQHDAIANDRPEELIDIVSLSLGYYHEQLGAQALDPLLYAPIRALGEMGVIVVTSAGNDATSRPMFPAAFTPYPGGYVQHAEAGCVPVISVGARNPDGSIALFSNDGDWVTIAVPGAALVSTFPKFNASGQAAYGLEGPSGWRSTIDPDSFRSGFGIWSGTSFAAPVLAGRLAQSLVDGSCGSTDDITPEAMLNRGWAAVVAHELVPHP